MRKTTSSKQSSTVSLFVMVVMQWHLDIQNAALKN